MNDLSKRVLIRSAVFFIVLGLLTFVPAWSLRFWQAWLYLGLFAAWTLGTCLYFLKRDPALMERRLKGGPTAEKEPTQRILQALASLFMVGLFILAGLDHRMGWSSVPVWLVLAGDALAGAGFLLVFLALKENSYAAATIELQKDHKVISTGPYRIVRHPMYSGGIVYLLGTPLALASYWALIAAGMVSAVIVLRLLDEERFLLKNLPGYAEYRQKVHYRLLPLVW